jgi:hypothetical protein
MQTNSSSKMTRGLTRIEMHAVCTTVYAVSVNIADLATPRGERVQFEVWGSRAVTRRRKKKKTQALRRFRGPYRAFGGVPALIDS